ncbi:MAG: hypothetical protein AAFR96_04235 [Planctomycetota bacterium]
MSSSQGLTESQRAILMAVDSVLVQGTPVAHVLAARQITHLWSEHHSVFQSQLVMRAEAWRRRQLKIMHSIPDPNRECERLMDLLALPGDVSPGVTSLSRRAKGGPNRCDARKIRRPITDAEVGQFLDLIDREGVDTVFDPNVSVVNGTVFRRALVVIAQKPVRFESVIGLYESGQIDRDWDDEERTPEMAVALDLSLLAAWQSKKWTWQVSDQVLSRLPKEHPYRAFNGERPGWKPLTQILERQGMLNRSRGYTWRLTNPARTAVEEHLMPAWVGSVSND